MELTTIVEALLVASNEALPAEELARIIRSRVAEAEDGRDRQIEEGGESVELPGWLSSLANVEAKEIEQAIESLNSWYVEQGRAFEMSERAKGWRIFTKAEYGEFTGLLFPGRKPQRLSAPAMETLAIVAYRQPVTKAAIEAVRGVNCDGMLQKLLDRELIRIGGRAELPGRPLLYETTELFFEHFGIRSIDDLPNSEELRKVELPDGQEEAAGEENPEGAEVEKQLALSAIEPSQQAQESQEEEPVEELTIAGEGEESSEK